MKTFDKRLRTPRGSFSRRQCLIGAGGSLLALPWLEALSGGRAFAAEGRPKRLVVVFRPNGVFPDNWWPHAGADESGFVLNTATAPLEPLRDQLLFVDGIDMPMAERGVSPGDEHQRGMGACLTGRKNQQGTFDGVGSDPSGYADGVSLDQHLAHLLDENYLAATGYRLPIGSLNLGVFSESTPSAPNKRRMIFSGPGQPIPSMEDPVQVYDAIFSGRTGEPSGQAVVNRKSKLVLDSVLDQLNTLERNSGAADRERLQRHAALVRSVEQRLGANMAECVIPAPPQLAALRHEEARRVSRLQIDLLVSALACDLTRVATLQYINSDNQYDFRALPDPANDHSMGHTEWGSAEIGLTREQGIARRLPRHVWYAEEFAYLLEQMASVREGEGSLLDSSVVLWISDMSTGAHSYRRMPYVLAGGGSALRTGRLVRFESRSVCDLFLSIIHLFGFEDTSFGDPEFFTGPLSGLS